MRATTELVRNVRPRSALLSIVGVLTLMVVAVVPGGLDARAQGRPEIIPLPDGFQPEGIAVGGNSFFVGSIPTGALYKGDLRTGAGSIFVPPQEGRSAIGLSLQHGMLFVAGGATGRAYVYDATTGAELLVTRLTGEPTFVNDVVATRNAAYFTDSVNPVIYKIPLEGGSTFGDAETLPLTGDIVYEEGFNANGIDATPNGKGLVLVQSNTGLLFEVDPDAGAATRIDLGEDTVVNGDGILLDGGNRLWVLQNRDNLLTLVGLKPDLSAGEVVGRFTHDGFDVPTTLARSGSRLALVNARFGNPEPESAAYWVTQIPRPAPPQ